jgi:hypothetical protein
MKIILFLSHCCALNNRQWSFRVFYLFTRWDWFRSSTKLRFYLLTCLRFSAELFLFVIFFYVLFCSRSTIFHLSTVASIIAKSLFHTISFQFDKRFSDARTFRIDRTLRTKNIDFRCDHIVSNYSIAWFLRYEKIFLSRDVTTHNTKNAKVVY